MDHQLLSLAIVALLGLCSGAPIGPVLAGPAQLAYARPAFAIAHAPAIFAPAPIARPPVAIASAPVAIARPPIAAVAAPTYDTYDPHPRYSFSYSVNDPVTGDNHGHTESRDGDVVRGSYYLVEPDGSLRVVDYTADPVNGFNANVRKDTAAHPVAAAPVAVVRPPIAVAQAPIAIARPPIAVAQAPIAIARPPIAYAPASIAAVAQPAYAVSRPYAIASGAL